MPCHSWGCSAGRADGTAPLSAGMALPLADKLTVGKRGGAPWPTESLQLSREREIPLPARLIPAHRLPSPAQDDADNFCKHMLLLTALRYAQAAVRRGPFKARAPRAVAAPLRSRARSLRPDRAPPRARNLALLIPLQSRHPWDPRAGAAALVLVTWRGARLPRPPLVRRPPPRLGLGP